jgi:microcystin-dependent protein
MADLIATGTSGYASGQLDTATVLVNNESPTDAKQPNGLAAAIVQIENILGDGFTLRGSLPTLGDRLTVGLTTGGLLQLIGASPYTVDRGFVAVSSSALQQMNLTPIGAVQAFAGSAAPANWLLCDGTAVSRTTYEKLFAVTSTTYGVGDGSTTFNVPDLRGRTVIMVDGAAARVTAASVNGANADTLGGAGGAETHTLTNAEAPAHTHTVNTFSGVSGGAGTRIMGTVSAPNSTDTSNSSGGDGAHSNTQPWLALNYIVFTGV